MLSPGVIAGNLGGELRSSLPSTRIFGKPARPATCMLVGGPAQANHSQPYAAHACSSTHGVGAIVALGRRQTCMAGPLSMTSAHSSGLRSQAAAEAATPSEWPGRAGGVAAALHPAATWCRATPPTRLPTAAGLRPGRPRWRLRPTFEPQAAARPRPAASVG